MALLLRKEIHMIYKITLFDANCPSCTSGTASFFTEDIDEFEHNYFSDENVESNQLEAQKQRYFRSKAGEIVTDYYSDDPELNIFQYAEYGTIEKRKTFHYEDKIFEFHNGYLISCPIYAAEAIVELAQIAFKKNTDEEGEKYLVARYSLSGVCCVGSSLDKFEDCTPYGNPIIKTCYPEDLPYKGEKEIYSDCKLSTFAWVELYQDCFNGDNVNGYEIEEPTEEQLAWIMRDIPGEAG